jgi:hypothetical protein
MAIGNRYEILNSLPVYGPMYVPVTENGKPYYSEGFPVRFFKKDGSEWGANFEPGMTTFLTYNPTYDADEWVAFTFNLDTQTLIGGSYHRNDNKRPWWITW